MARRVPHVLGLYLAAGWAVLEFTDWVVNRYLLSPHLADLALALWGLMIPTVAMLAYFHGRPGRDRWHLVEKIGIPVNLVLAAAILYASFSDKELGATTTQVTLQDESGAEIEREVPKTEFRKRLALYYFDNESGDSALDWLQFGVPLALSDDLAQDVFLEFRTSWPFFDEELERAGYPDGLDLPLGLRREIAEKSHLDYFVSGSIDRSFDGDAVTVRLHDTERGRLLTERTYEYDDVFELADRISLQLRRDLGIPEQHIEETPDLPAGEILTDSEAAFRHFVRGWRGLEAEEWEQALSGFSAAVEEDSAYSLANLFLYHSRLLQSDLEGAAAALEAAMRYSHKLPERYQFMMRAGYYRIVKQDLQKAKAVAGMLSELYPEDVAGHLLLVYLHQQEGKPQRAIEAAKRVLALDPGELDMLRTIAALHQELGHFEEAHQYLLEYSREAPKDPDAFKELGNLSRRMGELEEAKEYYERALALDAEDVTAMVNLAKLETSTGDIEGGEALLKEAEGSATTATQQWLVYSGLRSHYERRGRMDESVANLKRSFDALDRAMPPLAALQAQLGSLDTYVRAGRAVDALAYIREREERLDPPLSHLLALGKLEVASAMDDTLLLKEGIEGLDSLIASMELEVLRSEGVHARGRLHELRGDCEQAIVAYRQATELSPTDLTIELDIGRCHRKLGQFAVAEERLQRVLASDPYAPEANLEMARVLSAAGDVDRAITHLERALTVWAGADPEFEPAREARAAMAELERS